MSNAPHDPNQSFEQYSRPTPPPPKKKHVLRTVLIVVGSVFAVLILIGILAPSDPDTSSSPGAVATTADNGPTPDPITTPTNKPAAPKTTAKPSAKPSPKPTAAPKTTAAPTVYKKLTARQWAKIAKSPDDHAGEAYTVYGHVTQFDSATGSGQFRADVDGVRHAVEYGYVDYPTNTLMTNFSGDVSDLVEDDLFTAKVIVLGAYSYDTQIGGETTVPQLSVMSIKVTGSVK